MSNRIKLRKVIAEALAVPDDVVTDELSYNAIREWDSVAHLGLITAVEHAFAVMLDPEDITTMGNVNAIVCVLRAKGIDFETGPAK
jgi:acyl carrier protein